MVREEKQIPTAKTAVGMTNFIVWVPKGMIWCSLYARSGVCRRSCQAQRG